MTLRPRSRSSIGHPKIPFDQFEVRSVGNARNARESQVYKDKFLGSIRDRLDTAAVKGQALDLCQELFVADGALSDEEDAVLQNLTETARIDSESALSGERTPLACWFRRLAEMKVLVSTISSGRKILDEWERSLDVDIASSGSSEITVRGTCMFTMRRNDFSGDSTSCKCAESKAGCRARN